MSSLVPLAVLSLVVAANSFAVAGDVVEVRILDAKPADPPAAQAEGGPSEVPPDAKVVASIEALADAGGAFGAKCVVVGGGETLRLKGRVTAPRDGQRRVHLDFSHRSPSGLQEVTSIVTLSPEAQVVISRTTGSGFARLIVLTLKPDGEPAPECAE